MSAIILHCNHKNPHLFATEPFLLLSQQYEGDLKVNREKSVDFSLYYVCDSEAFFVIPERLSVS